MDRIRKLFRRLDFARPTADGPARSLERDYERTRAKIGSSVVFAMEVRDSDLKVIEHSALVSALADRIARRLGLNDADRYTLQTAAELHEVGMFAIPQELLHRPTPLSPDELGQVRAQAQISADVALLSQPPRVARLIKRQYEDYRPKVAGSGCDRDDLLAGVLRVADVIAAVTLPRAYQDRMPVMGRNHLLEVGSGTRFHPVVVRTALELEPA